MTGSRRNAHRGRFGGFFVSKSVFVTILPTLVTSFLYMMWQDMYFCLQKNNLKEMKDTSVHITVQFLTETYTTYRPLVFRYIYRKLNGCMETEDLVQDAFLRLLEYRSMLRPETVRSFLYTIVRNLVTDYLRCHYRKQEVMTSMQEGLSVSMAEVESLVVADDLALHEKRRVSQLPPKPRKVYRMIRFEEKTLSEVAEELNIPKRTVEGHLLVGRRLVREYMKKCI